VAQKGSVNKKGKIHRRAGNMARRSSRFRGSGRGKIHGKKVTEELNGGGAVLNIEGENIYINYLQKKRKF